MRCHARVDAALGFQKSGAWDTECARPSQDAAYRNARLLRRPREAARLELETSMISIRWSTAARRAPLLAGALLYALACSPEPRPRPPEQPDLILVTIDTLRADHLGSYGYALDVSPNLDGVAEQGVRFAEATAQWPSTWPSTASMLTGTYPGRNGVIWSPKRPLDWSQQTLAEILSKAGYRTGAVVSNASIGRRMQFHQGFDTFVESWLEGYQEEFPGRPYRARDELGVKRYTNATVVPDEALA